MTVKNTDKPQFDPKYVEDVNRAFHEEEAAEYDVLYTSMHQAELARWQKVAAAVAAKKSADQRPIALLDVGTGTGFIPSMFSKVLESKDRLTVSDLSPSMLALARRRLAESGVKADIEAYLGPIDAAEFPDGSFDVITMNSVVHHLPTPEKSFVAIDRWLKPGGILVIAHEPNLRHFRHPVVGSLDLLFRWLRSGRSRLGGAKSGHDEMYDRINRRLLAGGIIKEPMVMEDIERVVDVHSPTAGRSLRYGLGFDPLLLDLVPFKGYRREMLVTYQHFGKVNLMKSPLTAPFQRWVEATWPLDGALFMVMLRKPLA